MDLATLIAAARKTHPNIVGVSIISQGNVYVAVCIHRNGMPCDPRSWDTHPTPEAALADLERQLTK